MKRFRAFLAEPFARAQKRFRLATFPFEAPTPPDRPNPGLLEADPRSKKGRQ